MLVRMSTGQAGGGGGQPGVIDTVPYPTTVVGGTGHSEVVVVVLGHPGAIDVVTVP